MGVVHRYAVQCHWSGSTGAGYEAYSRDHSGTVVSAPEPYGGSDVGPAVGAVPGLALSADPAFRGDPSRLNPEQLVVLAAASCQLLSFLAVAARARLDVVAYADDATGEMPEDDPPVRLTHITLRPRITFAAPVAEARARHLVEVAHRECFVARSLRTEVTVEPTFDVASG